MDHTLKVKNSTAFQAIAQPMMGRRDRPALTVIVKGTFSFGWEHTELCAEQVPIAYGDTLYDQKEGGGVRYETDLLPFKPRTDVILDAAAHAPKGRPAQAVPVSVTVGPVQKHLTVFGKRLWNHSSVLSRRRYVITEAQPFLTQPIRYRDAFGGLDETTGEYCEYNLSGKGFYSVKTKANLAGKPLPLIEDPRQPIKNPADRPPIAGLGFYHRAWLPRARYAGTFDKAWRAERSPKMPADFNYRFYNGAHPDLQVKGFLAGNEPVELNNLTPEGHMRFALPGITPVCRVLRARQKEEQNITMHLDTVFIEPGRYRFCLVWRGAVALAALSDGGIEQVIIKNGAQ
jgi:hypothetical protein